MAEQRYKAVLAVIAEGRTVSEVATDWGVCRRTLHRWLARYEVEGLEGLGERSRRPGPDVPSASRKPCKIERFHRTLRIEFNTRQMFRNLKTAQEALDEWVTNYNTKRPHQALADATPESRFNRVRARRELESRPERNGEQWVTRTVASNGIVSVGYQQVCVGKHHGGSPCDVLVSDGLLQFWVGSELLKTVVRTSKGEIRKKHAEGTAPRR